MKENRVMVSPVSQDERIASLDVLRGFAILEIQEDYIKEIFINT